MNPSEKIDYQSTSAQLIQESIGFGDQVLLRVISDSMKPLLSQGDQVVIQKLDPLDYQVGDIITFTREKNHITHRLIDQNTEEWITQGDRSMVTDPAILPDQVIGKVIGIQDGDYPILFFDRQWEFANHAIGKYLRQVHHYQKNHPKRNYLHKFFQKMGKIIIWILISVTRRT